MNRAFHNGIVFVVALHMLCGCCFHHAHAYGVPSETNAFTVAVSCPCRHESAGLGQSGDHTSRHQRCPWDRCVFTRPNSNDAPDLSIDQGYLNLVRVAPCTATFRGIDTVDSRLGNLREPIPLHLLNQAILL